MLRLGIKLSSALKTMYRLPACCQVTSHVMLFLLVLFVLDTVFADTTAAPASTTTKEPFIKSTAFIGLAAGIGGFVGFFLLCCIVWKCFCGGDKND